MISHPVGIAEASEVPVAEAVPIPVPVEVRPKGISIDGRSAELPDALRQIAEELGHAAGDLINADRITVDITMVQSARTVTQFRIEAWRSHSP